MMKKLCFTLSLLLFSLNVYAVNLPRGVRIDKTRDGLKISIDNNYLYSFITIFFTVVTDDDGENSYQTIYVEKGSPEVLPYSRKEMNSFEVIDYCSQNIPQNKLPAGLTYNIINGKEVKYVNNSRNNYCIVADKTYDYVINGQLRTTLDQSVHYMDIGDEITVEITSVSEDEVMATNIHVLDVTIRGAFVYELTGTSEGSLFYTANSVSIDPVITFNMYRDASTDQEILRVNRQNAELLLQRINVLFNKAGVKSIAGISAAARVETKNGAPSYDGLHNYARAIDIKDPDGKLYQTIFPYIRGSNLRMEKGEYTRGWVHLDIGRQKVNGRVNYPTGDDDVQGGRVFDP
jgi:hypothetical protein